MAQYHFDPHTYLAMIRSEVRDFDALQDAVADATEGMHVSRILELGTGTGETARRVLAKHPGARLVGLDVSDEMLAEARRVLPPDRVEDLIVSGIEDPLPDGPFDLVVSSLVIHHLDGPGKADLFRRAAAVLSPGGRLVMGDVVVPENPDDAVTPLTEGYDLPSRPDELLDWLQTAGFSTEVTWAARDLLVVRCDLDLTR